MMSLPPLFPIRPKPPPMLLPSFVEEVCQRPLAPMQGWQGAGRACLSCTSSEGQGSEPREGLRSFWWALENASTFVRRTLLFTKLGATILGLGIQEPDLQLLELGLCPSVFPAAGKLLGLATTS